MAPKISIVTPSFNQARFLEETIRSVLCQREHVHEYFVIDGGSTDNSAQIIQKYAGEIDYWVSEADKGQSDAIHKGFVRATGDVLFWLNSDDVLLPDALARVRAEFERHPRWAVLTGWHAHIDAGTKILRLNRIPGESARWARWGVHHICQQTCFFRRELYERVGGLRLDLHCVMDTELWYRFFDAGAQWGHVREYLAGFRLHPDAKGSSWLQRYADEHRLLDQQYPAYHSNSWQHWAGQRLYKLWQATSPTRLGGLLQTRRWRGSKLSDVFGDWPAPSQK